MKEIAIAAQKMTENKGRYFPLGERCKEHLFPTPYNRTAA
jgi:hypothetical protein